MTNKIILSLAIIAAFVAGTIATDAAVFADKDD